MKKRIAGVHIRMRVLQSQSRFPRDRDLAFITLNSLIKAPLSFETDFSINKKKKLVRSTITGKTQCNIEKPVSLLV
jgi:hypothetical protein